MGMKLLDLVFPRRCPVCHDPVDVPGRLICRSCEGKLSFVSGPTCFKCGKEITDAGRELCRDCERLARPFSRSFALLNYDDTARSSILRFKNGGRREYADYYAEKFMELYGEALRDAGIEAVVPVPIHADRRYERGYNQAAEFGRGLARALQIPMREDLLSRVRMSGQQKSLSAAARARDIASSLKASDEAALFRRILLVDDVYTTGGTLSACARTLQKAGTREIMCAVIGIGSER